MTPGVARLLWRGCTGRCPSCGKGRLFRRWLNLVDRCPRCGLWFERTEGHWIGAIGMNTVATFGLLLLSLALALAITWPDIPAGPLMAGLAAFSVIFPVAFYPISKTLWTAIDVAMRPLTPEDFRAERAHRRAN